MKLTPRGEWPSGKNVLGLCTWLIHITCLPPTGKCVCDPFRHTMGPVPGISEWTNEWIYTCSQFFFFFWSHHVASGILFPWSEVAQSCPTLCDPIDCSLPGSSVHGIFPGNSTGVDCHFLLQRIFLTQGSNPGLLYCRQTLYRLSHQGSPIFALFYSN